MDCGYRGHGVTDSQIFISGQKRGVNAQLKRLLKRRQAIEPVIGHIKNDGLHAGAVLPERHRRRPDECDAELCGAQHAHNPEENQDYLRRLFAATIFLLRAGKNNVVSRFPERLSICLKIP